MRVEKSQEETTLTILPKREVYIYLSSISRSKSYKLENFGHSLAIWVERMLFMLNVFSSVPGTCSFKKKSGKTE